MLTLIIMGEGNYLNDIHNRSLSKLSILLLLLILISLIIKTKEGQAQINKKV